MCAGLEFSCYVSLFGGRYVVLCKQRRIRSLLRRPGERVIVKPLLPLDANQLQTAVHEAFVDLTRSGQGGADLLEHLLLVREELASREAEGEHCTARRAAYVVLEDMVERLARRDEVGAKVLRYRFFEGQITRHVAARLHASPDQVNRWQRAAIENLTAILIEQETWRRQERSRLLLEDLPTPSYSRLFGTRSLQAEITEQLLRQEEPLVIALSGIGGIGKTSLADAIARQAAPELAFERIIWLRAFLDPFASDAAIERSWAQVEESMAEALFGNAPVQGEVENLLDDMLHRTAVLMIIDNLEQKDQTIHFFDQVRRFAGPTKFLLTTRARPTVSAPVYLRSLSELDLADASDLLRYQDLVTGTKVMAEASKADIRAIYEVTGGNPLALKLVAGLSAVMSLSDILAGLQKSRPGPIENLYRQIYWQTWQTLSPDAKLLLQAMPLVAETGGLPQQLQAFSGLPEETFWSAVHELFARSLLEVRGTVHERRYSIHRLTETFLRTEIIHWPEDLPAA